MTRPSQHDVAVVGGGPGGSAAAAFLARAGHSVVLFEREAFPRFHVGESLVPATLSVLDHLGARDAVEHGGFQVKYGAHFSDQEMDVEQDFYFPRGRPWPHYAFQVPRADFDTLLLDHARRVGVDVRQPATVERVDVGTDGVTLHVLTADGPQQERAAVLVDASGRDGIVATRLGRRDRVPNLGKVALYAHWKGADRAPGIDEGSIRIHVFPEGWFWWIPFAGDMTSIGCVMHARTVRAFQGTPDELYDEMIGRCWRVAKGLSAATRVTPVHRAANFSYMNHPTVGDRMVAVGDAIAFVDPIFSAGVHVALASAEMASAAITGAFRDGWFEAARFADYDRAVWRGLGPFFRLIHKYYEPAFLEMFLRPVTRFGIRDAVLGVLAGGAFHGMSLGMRLRLEVVFGAARLNVLVRRRAGLPVESRLEW